MTPAPAPAFTVVMPAHDAAGTIDAAIRSVLAQTRDDYELVVVDDGSKDETCTIVERFADGERIRLIRQENRGPAAARNAGIAAARGGLVSFLDSDDLWLPTYLERMGAALDGDRGASFAYGDAWALDDGTRRIRRTTVIGPLRPPARAPDDPGRLLLELIERNFVFTAATIRRRALEEVGGFDESLGASEDYELWLRLAATGHRAVQLPGQPCAVYRIRAGSLSKARGDMLASLRRVYELVAEVYDVEPDARAAARARIATLDALERPPGPARRLRGAAGALRRRVLGRRLWYDAPPAEVAAAFPDLSAL